MLKQSRQIFLLKAVFFILLAVQLVGCGGGGSADTTAGSSTGNVINTASDEVELIGSVGDGPVTGATIEVWNSSGELLGTMRSNNTASFKSRFRIRRSHYPLLLKVRGGTDLVSGSAPDFQMLSVVQSRSKRRANINPYSTLMVKIAQALPGGINSDNLRTARETVMATLGFGMDTSLMADPVTVRITDQNVASLVKSSEALGEMVRRTRDAITAAGRRITGDRVMTAIAADLRDGTLDGKGGTGADPALTAVARVVSGQVLVETLANTLKVGGVVATNVIDRAIVTTRPGIGSGRLTQSVRVTAGMLEQTRNALAAARMVDSSAEVRGLDTIVNGITAGAMPDDVQNVLPASSSRSLDNAVLLSSTADTNQVAAVNAAMHSEDENRASNELVAPGPDTPEPVPAPPANHAPVISGSPAVSVQAGTVYSFRPVASDADGDALWFTITGKPSWASFNNWNGRLSGTPGAGDARTYRNITIAVSDGKGTTALPAFSVTVAAAPSPAPASAPEPTPEPAPAPAPAPEPTLEPAPAPEPALEPASAPEPALEPASAPVPAPVNSTPVISGSPAVSVQAGTVYSFRPTASDTDGDSLTFSITNKPVWASFDTGTGQLSGTPMQAGTYSNIVISVKDGIDSVALPAFDLDVQTAQATGSFTLSWTAPVTRTDGTPISPAEIDGYRIYYGQTSGHYPNSIVVSDGSANSMQVGSLAVGTYRVVMTTVDHNGLESAYSGEVIKTAQ